jgi:phosphoribosylanthranilate isomerase
MPLWIKICGNTSLADAELAADAGADAVGFVFAPSPRRVKADQVAAITPHLPAQIEKIGVFVDASLDEIAAAVRVAGLTGVQLHSGAAPIDPAIKYRDLGALPIARSMRDGWESTTLFTSRINKLPAELRAQFGAQFGRALRILSVVHFGADAAQQAAALAADTNIDGILIDSRTATAVGGTGIAFDWASASQTLFRGNAKMIAAGGLNPENVAEAIATLRPWGVDVVSGVEAAPGRKDPAKVRAFIANARAESE